MYIHIYIYTYMYMACWHRALDIIEAHCYAVTTSELILTSVYVHTYVVESVNSINQSIAEMSNNQLLLIDLATYIAICSSRSVPN